MRAPRPRRPFDADPMSLTMACLLLCVTDHQKWATWDKITFAGALFNFAFYVFRVVRMRRYNREIARWLEAR
jgi:hypothetical protein